MKIEQAWEHIEAFAATPSLGTIDIAMALGAVCTVLQASRPALCGRPNDESGMRRGLCFLLVGHEGDCRYHGE